jgi:hypothetical protein
MSAVPLAIFPYPLPPEITEVTKRAFMSLDLPFAVVPVPANPGEPGRILALGALPPFVCDCAPVADATNEDSVRNAIRWVLTAPQGDENGYMVLDYLKAAFGPETRELPPEEIEQKVRFA